MHDEEPTEESERSGNIPSHASIASPLDTWLRDDAVRATFGELCDGSVSSSVVGWPRLVPPEQIGSWVRPSDVTLEVASTPVAGPFELAVALHAESATRLVDRLLGAPTESGAASLHAAPSEAECGLLAYLAARLLRARSSGVLREVHRAAPRLASPAVVWPCAVHTTFGVLHATLVLSPAACERIHHPLSVRVSVRDRVDLARFRSALRAGDLVLSDAWRLSALTGGVAGPVVLTLVGTSTCLLATLADGAAQAVREAAPASDDELELVLAEREVSFLHAAEIASGAAVRLDGSPRSVRLLSRGKTVALGELVRHEGAVAMRVTHSLG